MIFLSINKLIVDRALSDFYKKVKNLNNWNNWNNWNGVIFTTVLENFSPKKEIFCHYGMSYEETIKSEMANRVGVLFFKKGSKKVGS